MGWFDILGVFQILFGSYVRRLDLFVFVVSGLDIYWFWLFIITNVSARTSAFISLEEYILSFNLIGRMLLSTFLLRFAHFPNNVPFFLPFLFVPRHRFSSYDCMSVVTSWLSSWRPASRSSRFLVLLEFVLCVSDNGLDVIREVFAVSFFGMCVSIAAWIVVVMLCIASSICSIVSMFTCLLSHFLGVVWNVSSLLHHNSTGSTGRYNPLLLVFFGVNPVDTPGPLQIC